ncbi:DNA-binding GntR family transcriptional regulator [Actinocorallia herbida]|uniref:DNA-binding GntR family transcriptional regulator n=1 Tax=Actinocorallia herbida TaxID=58109 RepID=A0A3N1DCI9_9ACTN|nr:GntR family transcriptional regulator [Actinocorallia herbida]ROO91244.1 DNA-binding GntR family transcriptional regulator [Actinocorallia herbida]
MVQPAYQRIADELRERIVSGELEPGARLPSRAALAAEYRVADSVALQALRLLASEGLVVGRSGSGTYVREKPELRRLTRSWYRESRDGSPFRADMAAQRKSGGWRAASETAEAPPAIAERLAIAQGDAVMRTRYTFLADDEPVMLSTSWEPLALTGGTDVMLPEDGPYAGRGVTERMRAIGVNVDVATEVVTARAALTAEATELGIPTGALVIVIQRTYTGDRPVETADIIVPVDRYELAYVIPVEP